MTSGKDSAIGPRMSMRNYFSTSHLWTALRLARMATDREVIPGRFPRFDIAHRSLVVNSIVASAAFFEAAVSELFEDAHDGYGTDGDGYLAPLNAAGIEAMRKAWRADHPSADRGMKRSVQVGDWRVNMALGVKRIRSSTRLVAPVERADPLEKWQQMLELNGRSRLPKGSVLVHNAKVVVQLRNHFIHFKPESLFADESSIWEKRLRRKFVENPLMVGSGNPWWPDHALSSGAASWASDSAVALADAVMSDLGVTPSYARIRADGWMGDQP